MPQETQAAPQPTSPTKTERLRSAYEVFQQKLQGLREERLQFMKSKFKELDEQKLARLMKEIE
jgi:hypothetical protein